MRFKGLKVNIKQEERYNVSQLFQLSLLTGLATSFFSVVTSSYFIKKLDVFKLPLAYILSGLVGFLVIHFYKKLMNRYGLIKAIVLMNILYLLICGSLLYARLHDTSSLAITQMVAFTGFVFIMPFSSLFALSFATLSLRMFDIGQSKRLIAWVGLGEVLASIAAYLMVPFLTKLLGSTAWLLAIAMASVLFGIIPVRRLASANREKFANLPDISATPATKVNFSFLLSEKYYFLIGIFTVFSVSAIYVADYSYLLSVKFLFVENNIETALLVSWIFTVIKLGELAFTFFSSRFISEYGMKLSLVLLPLLLTASSILGFVSGSIFQSVSLFIVAFLLVNKWVERVIRKGITNPALKILYQVTQPSERARVQTLIDGTLSQVSTMLAGVILLIMATAFRGKSLYVYLFILTLVCFVLNAAWLFYTHQLYAQYKEKIQRFLKSNESLVDEKNTPETDIIRQWLLSVRPYGTNDMGIQILLGEMDKIAATERNNRDYAYQQMVRYNFKAFKNIKGWEDELLLSKISGVLYSNDFYLGKIAVIHYAKYLPANERIKLVRNHYEVLDHSLQTLLLLIVNEEPLQCAPDERFYFTELCRRCVEDVLWIEQTEEDIATLEDTSLNKALTELKEEKIFQLLQLFRILYDAGSVSIVNNIWQNREQVPENHEFAIELLENILDKDMKKIVVPLLEEMPLQIKKEKLREVFYFHRFDITDRLKDIIMKDFNLLNPYIKELAMMRYITMTDNNKIGGVFRNHSYMRLAVLSQGEEGKELLLQTLQLTRKIGIASDWYQRRIFDVLVKWVIQHKDATQKGHASELGNGNILFVKVRDHNEEYHIDYHGLSLLLITDAVCRRRIIKQSVTN